MLYKHATNLVAYVHQISKCADTRAAAAEALRWRRLLVDGVGLACHTNLQAALDQVEGHHGRVREAAAQDAAKAAQGVIL